MAGITDFFNQGWVGSLIGIFGTLVGIAGFFSYKISKSTAKPAYQKSSLKLLSREESNLPEEVTVLFRGAAVERLTKTTLIIWNNGTEVLVGKDIVAENPVQIYFDDNASILSYSILKVTNKFNNFKLVEDSKFSNRLFLEFDYLDPQDGVVVELLHSSVERYPKISGTIRGLPKGFIDMGLVGIRLKNSEKKVRNKFPYNYLSIKPKYILIMATVIGVLMIVAGLVPSEVKVHIDAASQNRIFLVVSGIVYAVFPLFILWSRREKYPKKLSLLEE